MPVTITELPCDPTPGATYELCSYQCPAGGLSGPIACRTVDDGSFTATCAVVCAPDRAPVVVPEPEVWMACAALGILFALPLYWRACVRAMERP